MEPNLLDWYRQKIQELQGASQPLVNQMQQEKQRQQGRGIWDGLKDMYTAVTDHPLDKLISAIVPQNKQGMQQAAVKTMAGLTNATSGLPSGVDVDFGREDLNKAAGEGGKVGALLGMALPSPKIKTFHGSPANFRKFSNKYIGSGEGAQAFGYGHYSAENEKVGVSYADKLRKHILETNDKQRILLDDEDALDDVLTAHPLGAEAIPRELRQKGVFSLSPTLGSQLGYEFYKFRTEEIQPMDKFIEFLRNKAQTEPHRLARTAVPLADAKEVAPLYGKMIDLWNDLGLRPTKEPGFLYELGLAGEPKNYLSLDEPLYEQSVMENLQKIPTQWKGTSVADYVQNNPLLFDPSTNMTTQQKILRNIGKSLGNEAEIRPQDVSQRLLDAGILGNRYYDGFSRRHAVGTENYVSYNPNDIKIVTKKIVK